MSAELQRIALLAAGLAFVVFMLVKLLGPRGPARAKVRAARQRIAEAKRRAGDRALPAAARATALREAALVALEELERPDLAASYARRADRLDPDAPEGIRLLSAALRRASRFRALERLLWRRIAEAGHADGATARAFDELLALYEGPLKRPEMAQGLRRLRAAS